MAPVVVALGMNQDDAVAMALQDISQKVDSPDRTVPITITTHKSNASLYPASSVRAWFAGSGHDTRIIAPDSPIHSFGKLFIKLGTFRRVDLESAGARFNALAVRRDVADALYLIGVSNIGSTEHPGPLAIGLWSRFVDPRLAIALRQTRRRIADSADIALAFSPSLLVLIGEFRGYVACVAAGDLVAAELVGLAVRSAAIADPEFRPRPWEDPVVQRATELDLGIQRPDQLDLRTVWAGPSESAGIASLKALNSTVRELLNLPDIEFDPM